MFSWSIGLRQVGDIRTRGTGVGEASCINTAVVIAAVRLFSGLLGLRLGR